MNQPAGQRPDVKDILDERTARPGRRLIKWAIILLALGGAGFYATEHLSTGNEPTIRYVTEPVTRGALTVIVTATGSVQPTNQVDVSSELSGTMRGVFVDYNSPVKAGMILAELDADRLSATVNSSRARLASSKAKVADAEATVTEKERDLARKKRLVQNQAVSLSDVDQAQASYDRAQAALLVARAEVGVSQADLQLNESNLAKTKIVSPISGVVLKRNVDPGQTVASSLQAPVLFSIAEDLKRMQLQVDIDEADVGRVKAGQTATFGVDAFADRKFPATIRDVRYASETIQGVVTYKAMLDIDNSELLLRPGMTATAEIKVQEIAEATLTPNAALRFAPPADAGQKESFLRRLLPGPPAFRPPTRHEETGRNRSVHVLVDGAPKRIAVVIGESDGKRTVIESGEIAPGQAVIVDQVTPKR